MTLVSAGQAVTGPGGPVDYLQAIRTGGVGTVSNLWGPAQTREVQRIALEETRLRHPAAVRHGRDPRPSHGLPAAARRGRRLRPGPVGRTARVAATEAAADGLAMTYAPMLDVARDPRWGRIAESPGEDPWLAARFAEAKVRGLSGRRSRGRRQPGRHRQASGRLWRGHRRPGLCHGRHLGPLVARDLPAALPGGGRRRRRRDHAGLPRPRRRADDRERRRAARRGARALGLRGRHRQRLRRDRRADGARRRRGPRRGGRARAAGRHRHRPDGQRLCPRPAGRARARPRDDGRHRRRRPADPGAQGRRSACSTTRIGAAGS